VAPAAVADIAVEQRAAVVAGPVVERPVVPVAGLSLCTRAVVIRDQICIARFSRSVGSIGAV